MSAETESATTPPRKYSRYRSVRLAEAAKVEPPVVPAQQDGHDAAFTRSMSRYRRTRVVPKQDHLPSPPLPSAAVPPIPLAVNANGAKETIRRVTEPTDSSQKQRVPTRHDTVASPRGQGHPRETDVERQKRKAREIREQEEQYRRAQKEQEEQELARAKSEMEQAREAKEEAARLLAEQKRKDLERLEAELDAAAPSPPPPRVTTPGREKFNFFSRKRAATKASPPTTAGSGKKSTSITRTKSIESAPRPSHDPLPRGVEHGGSGVLPGADAPISAVNAGERRVLIRCKQSSINLPINPGTTPMDLVYSAANIMTQNIATSTAILLESYTQLGLERRIRRYEHIRDIMNSWDRDTQNSLIIQNSDSPNHDHDLETYSVPRDPPKDFSVHMFHSQKPGRWNKRHITLLSSGQIFMAKKAGAKASDKDVVNLCHLSDFDIYTPTAQQLRKNLKPPKKFCYAIKSQQKTTMFLSTENFVHFFNTDDEALAEKWYNAAQRWRSWYLVNRKGAGRQAAKRNVTELSTKVPGWPGAKATHKVKVSVDEDPYTIGSFKPLMSMDRFGSQSDPDYDSEEENRPRQIPFHLRHSLSLAPLPSQRESKRHPPPVAYRLPADAEDEFASSGLLGRTYSQRQRAYKEREAALKQMAGPFSEGPSLLNGNELQRPATSGGSGLQRSTSTSKREKPKPLLDFTPQFKEVPQWDKTGKGHGVPAPLGVPLVEVATNPEPVTSDLPSTTVFRREGARPATAGAGKQSEGAFVKGGLLSGRVV